MLMFILILALSSANVHSEKVHFKGNLLFKETGTNYLNQEYMIFSRLLDTNDLRLFTQTYQDSSNTYASFCDSIKRLFYKINPQQAPPTNIIDKNFTIIPSTTQHTVAEAAAVCRGMGARLPEIRNRAEDRDLLEAVERYKVKTVLAGIKFDHRTSRFQYESDFTDVSSNTVYQQPYYGGTYTGEYYKADSWSDRYLIDNAKDYYLTYIRANDGMAFRLSDRNTMDERNIILCQKPIPEMPMPTDNKANILIQMTMSYCTRDLQSVAESTANAIEQIQLITTLDLNINKTSSILKDYLPHFKEQPRNKREVETEEYLTTIPCEFNSNDTHKCINITTANDLWTPLFVENEANITVTIIPNIANSTNDLMEQCYEYWYYANIQNITDLPFHDWLNYQLKDIKLQMCSLGFGHFDYQPNEKLYPIRPKTMALYKDMNVYKDPYYKTHLSPPRNPFVKEKSKRDLATVATTTVLGTLIGGSAYIIKSFIDMFSVDRYVTKKDFSKLAHNMNDIRINQVQLQDAMRQIVTRMNHYESNIKDIYNGVAAQNMELDIRFFNRHLQSVLATTLNSYAQAFLAAMDGKTSPYALSPIELQKLSSDIHTEKRITLDTNINNVRTTALILNNTIRFFFEVPIISEEASFKFYSIIPVPAFYKNETFLPDIDATNIAISKDGTKYTTLTPEESAKCMNIPPICKTHRPITPVSNKALCVISTYTTSQRTCKMKPTSSTADPFLYFEDVTLYFSVPYNTSLFISCPKTRQLDEQNEMTAILYGMGEAKYRPSCTITLPDSTTYKTPSRPEVHLINGWPMFDIIKALPHMTETFITIPTEMPPLQIPSPILTEDPTQTIMSMGWIPSENKIYDILINLFTILVPIFLLILLLLCFKRKIITYIRGAIFKGSYKISEDTESAKDDFDFLSVPLTPSVVRYNKDLNEISVPKNTNSKGTNNTSPIPTEANIPTDAILKPKKNVQFKY